MQELIFIFFSGFFGYPLIEYLWRGYSHPTMSFAGGICFLAIYIFSVYFPDQSALKKAFFLSLIITCVELLFGIVFNLILKLDVWDYSSLKFNLWGQICPLYSLLWFLLAYFLIPLCSRIHNFLFT